jgi:hypothetical protein
MALAAKIPFRHPYAAGFPGLGSQAVPTDADALDYLDRMAAADGASVEVGVATAVDAFFRGLKSTGQEYDGVYRTTFESLKACCILAGARTLAGALIPLKGDAPTPYGFVSGDYSRTGGLGDPDAASYLDSNRANNADPQNDHHFAAYATSTQAGGNISFIGAVDGTYAKTIFRTAANSWLLYDGRLTAPTSGVANASLVGLVGVTRTGSSAFSGRVAGVPAEKNEPSFSWGPLNIFVFGYNGSGTLTAPTSSRLAFYSIGTSLSLEDLDTAVTNLITAIGEAL